MKVLLSLDLRVHGYILDVPALYSLVSVCFASHDDPGAKCLH